MSPVWRTVGLHVGSVVGGGLFILTFAATQSIDLYAIVKQMNVVWVEILKLVALLGPFIAGAIAAWKARPASKLIDLSKDPDFKGAVVSPELALAVPSAKVVASVQELPRTAKEA